VNRILELDPVSRTARVEPWLVLSALNAAAAPHGLEFGPDPSSASRATLGSMIANNACGAHSVAFGTTADNVVGLDGVLADGTRMRVDRGDQHDVGRAMRRGRHSRARRRGAPRLAAGGRGASPHDRAQVLLAATADLRLRVG